MRRKFQEPIIKRIRKTMLGKNKFRLLTATLAFTMLTSSFYYPLKMDVVAASGNPQVGGGFRGADEDTSANQTFDNSKIKDANSKTLSDILKSLPEKVENNSKVKDKMTELGDKTQVKAGEIKEIKEFGGWTAIKGGESENEEGKFAIAKKTQYGFFPIGTINVTRAQGKEGGKEEAFVQESVLDTKNNDYTLLLGKTVTGANRDEPAHDGTPYKHTGEGGDIARNVKGFNGIEKTFKAYSPETGSNVKVGFKIGYTGDINGKKAKYKVVVLAHTKDGQWESKYLKVLDPTKNTSEVKAAKDGTVSQLDVTGLTKEQAEAKINNDKKVPNGTVGTFLSEDIQLPVGATEYKVKISIGDQDRLGMSYQSKYQLYALPISGADFNITQDTRQLAKSLFTQIYNKLLEEKAEDIKNKTPESIAAYEAELEKMKALVDSTELNSKADYVTALEKVEQTHKNLVSPILDLVAPATKVPVKNPAQLTEQEKQAVKDAVKDANKGLNLDDKDITVDNDGKVTVKKGDKTGTIEAGNVVEESKVLDLVAPATKVPVKNPAQLTEQEKQAVKDAVKDANKGLNLDDKDITVDNDGKVTVKKGDKTGTIEAGNVVEESKALDLVAPTTKVAVKNPAQLTEQEKQAVKDAIKEANPTLKLEDANIDVKDNGEAVVTKDGKKATVPANQAVSQDNESQDSYIPGYGDYFPGGIKIKEYSTPTHPVIVSIPKKSEELVKGKGESLWYVFHIDKLEYDVVINGVTTKRTMDITPIISKGRTMVPLRYVAEVIGAEVKWDAETRTASFTKNGLTASIQIDGDEIVLSNGKTIKMDSKPLIVKDRMLVSVVNLANVFGLTNGNEQDKKDQDIEWNQEVRTVTVYVKR